MQLAQLTVPPTKISSSYSQPDTDIKTLNRSWLGNFKISQIEPVCNTPIRGFDFP